MQENLSQLQQFINIVLSSPMLFLGVIGLAIAWQQINSRKLAEEAGQQPRQANFFSVIMAVTIFLCVANDRMLIAVLGAVIESIVNVFLVFKTRQVHVQKVETIMIEINSLGQKQKKGPERRRLEKERMTAEQNLSKLDLWINLFISILIPLFIVFMSELYMQSE